MAGMSKRAAVRAESPRRSAPSSRQARPAAGRQESQSLRDLAYEAIKHRIITCSFKPGEYLNEARVSALLGFGRTPVHQAIDRLMMEKMVEVIPRKGVIVKPVSFDDVVQIIETRLLIEPQSARLAAARAAASDITELGDILARARHEAAARNVEQMMLLDRSFHAVLARAARNNVCADMLRSLNERSLRFWFISLADDAHHEAVQAEHRAILRAIETRDADAAEAAMRTHIESFRKNISHRL
jgi:DNA-binding GntR family transcriptional regulator